LVFSFCTIDLFIVLYKKDALFVTNDLREEREESTHDNILRDDITLISIFAEIMGVMDVNKGGDFI
jgi:hypothetical protein